ncbi:hypothetical protein RGE_01910 [Rubrivivax gelatinosus IL144]|uniref:Uncharacterized protein n=1 Tax=Rubrivivax gelatinosus (strain NBRC 100245 / IL144) TaxID=983917 RepID=I0HKJ9_RUBGI|nr:hypothetical protein RGE_01910 [Rubrivivax gelatinosus IL144]
MRTGCADRTARLLRRRVTRGPAARAARNLPRSARHSPRISILTNTRSANRLKQRGRRGTLATDMPDRTLSVQSALAIRVSASCIFPGAATGLRRRQKMQCNCAMRA